MAKNKNFFIQSRRTRRNMLLIFHLSSTWLFLESYYRKMESSEESFCVQMRKATRKVHSISDTLVQSKFVLGLIDDRVWAEGLLVFYEVFSFLEGSIERQVDTPVGKFDHPALKRIPGFEADLSMYYGADWKRTHCPTDRECVRQVLAHLEEIEKTDPVLLIAYIYHLYLGLLSGGQILRKKQKLMRASQFAKQSSVVDFDPKDIQELKKFIKETMNDVAATMSEDTKKRILDESVKVFQFNCELIRSVRSTNDALLRIGRSIAFATIFAVLAVLFYKSLSSTEDDEKQL